MTITMSARLLSRVLIMRSTGLLSHFLIPTICKISVPFHDHHNVCKIVVPWRDHHDKLGVYRWTATKAWELSTVLSNNQIHVQTLTPDLGQFMSIPDLSSSGANCPFLDRPHEVGMWRKIDTFHAKHTWNTTWEAHLGITFCEKHTCGTTSSEKHFWVTIFNANPWRVRPLVRSLPGSTSFTAKRTLCTTFSAKHTWGTT